MSSQRILLTISSRLAQLLTLDGCFSGVVRRSRHQCRTCIGDHAAAIERLDRRRLLSAASSTGSQIAEPTLQVERINATSAANSGYSPSQLQTAYGFNQVSLSNGGNGSGQTIAIVDAYDDPTIQSDLKAFDVAFHLVDPPSLTVVSQTGTSSLPSVDPAKTKSNDWEVEESLDVEWAHALAPYAKIVLVEANSASNSDLMTAVRTAASLPGVSVVSMSWGGSEFSSESSYDSYFTTPSGHQGVTFVSSTGDSGAPGGFPAYSRNVLAVGGTSLTISSTGSYVSESGWSGSGGGISQYEAQPSYQSGVVTQTTTRRAIPDVSFDANPNTGVPVYDTFSFGTSSPWSEIGGTSLSAPSWAAVISIVDQARAVNGLGTLDGASQTLPMLYQLDKTQPSAFHDISTGNNGYSASSGYDLVTGLGSPVVNVLVAGMSGSTTATSHLAFNQFPTTGTVGKALSPSVTVAIENQSGQVITTDNSTVTIAVASGPGGFASSSTISVQAVNGIATFSNLILNTAGTYQLSATDTGRISATSSTLTISAAVTLSAPKNVSVVALSSTTAQVSWEAVSGAQGYRVFQVVGTSFTLLGSVSASATSMQVSGLSAGQTYSFMVEAYSGATVADSQVVSVTMPSGFVLRVQVLSSTTAQLSWNPVSGVQGYRVYQATGSGRTLLGTLRSGITSVEINGMASGRTYQFQVEAYRGSTVLESNWVTVSTPSVKSHLAVASLPPVVPTSSNLNRFFWW